MRGWEEREGERGGRKDGGNMYVFIRYMHVQCSCDVQNAWVQEERS